MAQYDLERFLKGQARNYDAALREIRDGCKRSHWMWYVFPQIQGLGYSSTAQYYAIKNLEETKAYLQHPVLRERLLEISGALLTLDTHSASEVFGWPDDMKLRSSMTLFAEAEPECSVFQQVLDQYFNGRKDDKTLAILASQA
ncbi:MAG: DUF1810 domain-containing protein [Oscillospiraceae bacterium]|nr:DUF1810 domain-containing protein [Oscillospiraceae bacterium]MBR1533287.1 DUF1810 domain-containing protein [Ruminococcus sp.]